MALAGRFQKGTSQPLNSIAVPPARKAFGETTYLTMTNDKERERQRIKQATAAAVGRDISIPPPEDISRRAACLADPFAFLRTYFADIFWQPFTADRREMVAAIIRAATYSGDSALAGPRGEGKTKLAIFTALYLILNRTMRLPIIIGKNQSGAENELTNLKRELTAIQLFAADFPEISAPLIALDGWASRARKQTVNGEHTDILWARDCLILPTIRREALGDNWPPSVEPLACGQGIATVGIGGKIRGYNRRNIRPDMAIVDDIDDRESARSAIQTADHRIALDQDIAGLAGSGQRIARVMLCTTINRRCIAWIYTDRQKMPGWQGKRFAAIPKLPDLHGTFWAEYIELRSNRDPDSDPDARVAYQFYVSHRDEMDCGAIVSNEYAFEGKPAADDEPLELSALQACYNKIADTGWDAFATEYQNEPPEETQISRAGISRQLVASRISGLARRELPPDCTITIGIDVGKRFCHWVAGAVRNRGHCSIIDYGVIEVVGAEDCEQHEIIERAIVRALCDWRDAIVCNPFRDADGNPVVLSYVLIDAGYSQSAILEFVSRYGDPYRAAKGASRFHHGVRGQNRRVGNHWFAQPQHPSRVWLYSLDSDFWKRAVHDRFVTQPLDDTNRPNAGALTLFAPVGRRDHHTFASHVISEEWITEDIPGKGERSRWLVHSGNNHFLDSTALMLATAEMCGAGIFKGHQRPKRSLAAMAGSASK